MILVTGSTGYIGKPFTAELLQRDREVKVLTREPALARKLFPKATVHRGDISDKKSIKRAMKDVTEVVHLAGLVDYRNRERIFRVNYQGTKNLLECCDNIDKLVFSSSVTVFGNVVGKADDKTPLRPTGPYGKSKAMAEKLIVNSGIKSAMLRIAPVYGEGSPWFSRLLKMLSWGVPCPKTDSNVQLVHISDATNAILLSLDRGSGAFIIADEKPAKLMHVTEKLVGLLGKRYWTVPNWMITGSAKIVGMGPLADILLENRVYDISNSKIALGFRPKASMDLELKRMVDWYLAHRQ